jgi:hypothetical protein
MCWCGGVLLCFVLMCCALVGVIYLCMWCDNSGLGFSERHRRIIIPVGSCPVVIFSSERTEVSMGAVSLFRCKSPKMGNYPWVQCRALRDTVPVLVKRPCGETVHNLDFLDSLPVLINSCGSQFLEWSFCTFLCLRWPWLLRTASTRSHATQMFFTRSPLPKYK